MERIPQVMYGNPARTPESKMYLGLPILSSVYLNFTNTGFKYSDLISHTSPSGVTDDSLHLNIDNMLGKLSKYNFIGAGLNTDLFSFGLRLGSNFFRLGITEKVQFRFGYPKDFMKFVLKGNGAFLGQTASFKDFGVDASHYREYGLGFSRDLDPKLTVGVYLKYLYGMENINTENSDVSLTTAEQDFQLTSLATYRVNTSYPTSTTVDDSGVVHTKYDMGNTHSYLFGSGNRGFAADFGAVYKLNDHFEFTASLLNLGSIRWKSGVTNYSATGANVSFDGLDFSAYLGDTSTSQRDSALKHLGDSLSAQFKPTTTYEPYTTKLSPQIMLGANYYLSEHYFAGILLRAELNKYVFMPSMTLSFNGRLTQLMSASVSYSILNKSYNNIGFGLASTIAAQQLYLVTDNVLGMFLPQNAKNINVRFGYIFVFGHKGLKVEKPKPIDKPIDKPKVTPPVKATKKDKDGDGILDEVDKCPDTPGLAIFQGCPDTDNDSVPDIEDNCPDVPGLVSMKGCPDKDGDGITDKEDNCPDVAGLAKYHGCPDTDGDGIIDSEDSCKTIPGTALLHGCPDRDGDGITDSEDQCPDNPGPIIFHGCPDSDGDGILDKDDECPTEPGLKIYQGCPDRDLDGVPDKFDQCPDTYGSKENHGCPLVEVKDTLKTAKLTQQEQQALKTAFENLNFESGSAVIRGSSLGSLDTLAEVMKKKPELKLYIAGHTDNVGDAGYNLQLSQDRANSVKVYLVSKGVDGSKITTEGFGLTRPAFSNDTEEGQAKNRRVELKLTQ